MSETTERNNLPAEPGDDLSYLINHDGNVLEADVVNSIRQLQDALKRLKSSELSQLRSALEPKVRRLPGRSSRLKRPHHANVYRPLGEDLSFLIYHDGNVLKADLANSIRQLQDALKRLKSDELSQFRNRLEKNVKQLQKPSGKPRGVDLNRIEPTNPGDQSDGLEAVTFYMMLLAAAEALDDLKSLPADVQSIDKRKARVRRAAAAGMGAGLVMLVGFIYGSRFRPIADATSTAVQRPLSNVAVPIGAAPDCKITLLSPADGAVLPISGPVNVQWFGDPPGATYALEVVPPSGARWTIPTDGTSKNIHMENYPAGGAYELKVSALDASGKAVCSVVGAFEKPAFDLASGLREEEDGTQAEIGQGCIPTIWTEC